MALRKSLSRRRILAGVFAPTALGVVAAAAIVLPQQDTPTVADPYLAGLAKTTECHDMVSLGIGGRGDIPRDESKMLVDENGNRLPAAQQGAYGSMWVDPVINAPMSEHAPGEGYAAIYIEYPADLASYENAVNKGAENTIEVMKAIRRSCPDTQFAIVGFSEGADVARRAAMQIGTQKPGEDGEWDIIDPDAVSGVVILSDAGRREGEGFFPGSKNGTNPDGFDRPYQPGADPVPGRGVLPDTSGDFGELAGKVASFCSEGDFTCSAPENIALIELLANVGRQVNGDALEREGLTPATGADLAQVIGRVALLALADISANPDWMRSDETFLEVLIKVSDPSYDPATARPTTPVAADADEDATGEDAAETPIPAKRLSNLAYLPEKIVKEVVGFIRSNENTLAVVLADPYDQTFGYNEETRDHYGHHFDYWDDIDGKGTSTAAYAAAWLEHLAREAKEGNKIDPNKVDKATVLMIVEETAKAETAEASTTPETSPSSTVTDDATVADSSMPSPVDGVPAPAGDPAAPVAPPALEAGVTAATPTPVTTTAPVPTPSETTTPATGETTTGAGSTTSSGTPTTTVAPTTTTSPEPAA
ncbi:cutinase [Rhodococcus pyridinivorans SB3094]|uniref:Cutinase n=1 Tax=Rhodococcus pyridinivorans SB3094 TaxID=1435356 RepID=V9XDL5_9NOCA|nr:MULTISPECIES: cutinase family protein [Rhodococcus]AHD20458.1 cutinase [Rhodococcus pyridinivorans SB3094]MCT7292765.1 cutinase family protein [Rhodococcus sp. PAE-6]